ncbi:hypothetical protein [Corynebacterium glutamicum]|uniref:hypothetical protein n=1 Tax=Corynebacterium glutamicum TaxID=1718 RepID=UPI0016465619|nr:hypothetical protein [Corynebacterium glutamicum]
MTTGEDTHGCDYFTSIFLLPQLCNSTGESICRSDLEVVVGVNPDPDSIVAVFPVDIFSFERVPTPGKTFV